MEWGGQESLLAKDRGRTKWPCGDIGRRSTGAGGRLRATFTVQRGRPPSAPAFSCWKDLSEGWGLPEEGTADWEPSPPLWLALLKICQTLQCKNRRKTSQNGGPWVWPQGQRLAGAKIPGPGILSGCVCRHKYWYSLTSSGKGTAVLGDTRAQAAAGIKPTLCHRL